jgi:hypothetical protein
VHCAADGDDAGARPKGAAEQVGEQERPEMVDPEIDFKTIDRRAFFHANTCVVD